LIQIKVGRFALTKIKASWPQGFALFASRTINLLRDWPRARFHSPRRSAGCSRLNWVLASWAARSPLRATIMRKSTTCYPTQYCRATRDWEYITCIPAGVHASAHRTEAPNIAICRPSLSSPALNLPRMHPLTCVKLRPTPRKQN